MHLCTSFRQTGRRPGVFTFTVLFFVLARYTAADASPAIAVAGGIQTGNSLQPLVFTWTSPVPLQGSGWRAGEVIAVSLEGPQNTPGVAPASIPLGSVTADSQGTFSSSLSIPYDSGITGPQANIPRPGLYTIRGSGPSGVVSAANPINLAPATYTGAGSTIDWSHERGTRVGVLPGPIATYSPERSDPNWITVWDNRPTELYGSVVGVGGGGDGQPARISYEEDPLTHYAHDTNFYVLPDPNYRWTVGTANYYSSGEDESGLALGRIEVEWEALNNGSPKTYGTGQIGLPDWAIASTGDRMYVVGRWVLDAGHPDVGDRTEMHPPRLVGVIRRAPVLSGAGDTATQVDIYVSGHGGGANLYPAGMDALLNQGGRGGGRLRDVLSAADQQTYYQAGPLPFFEVPIIEALIKTISGGSVTGPINSSAGPSAFSWGKQAAPENQPINDMDYDFDVPLPPPPTASATLKVEVTTHPQHTSAVTEAVTYVAGGNAGPAAHIHLPYRSADNGIYARTLKIGWSTPAPPHHFHVTLDHLTATALPGEWHVWSDMNGQWTYLPALAPSLLQSSQGQNIATPGAQFDVYLRSTDTLRVLVQGYRANCVDHLFGTLFGMASYAAGIQLLETCGPVNNDDLGGALLELPALPSSQGTYTVKADVAAQAGGGAFQASIIVQYVNPVQVSPECQGRGSLSPAIASGGIVGAGLSTPPVKQFSPGALISVFGQNFAPAGTARGLTAPDVQGGQVPVNLGCTCVAINHQLAPLLYVSPTLINLQVPSSVSGGTASVQVVSNCGAAGEATSNAQTAAAQPVAPEFFFFQQNSTGRNPIAATNAVTGALIGAPGLLAGATFTPAKPGDYVALYATGLGPTDPQVASGALAAGIARTIYPVSVSVNGNQLGAGDILYAGAAPGFAGLYQINVRIPAGTPDGDIPVSLSVAGISTPAGAFITVQH